MITNINELNNLNELSDAGIYGLNGVNIEGSGDRWGYVYVMSYGNFTVQMAVFLGVMYIRDYAGSPKKWSRWSIFKETESLTQSGETDITPSVANQVVSKSINFPKPYKSAPSVTINAKSAVPQNIFVCAGDISNTGFTVYLHRNNTTLTGLCWIANGK